MDVEWHELRDYGALMLTTRISSLVTDIGRSNALAFRFAYDLLTLIARNR